jgi:hypothetical protein
MTIFVCKVMTIDWKFIDNGYRQTSLDSSILQEVVIRFPIGTFCGGGSDHASPNDAMAAAIAETCDHRW